MWLPDRLYRALPLIYAAGGAVTLALFGTRSPSALSSVLLFTAAVTTVVWRTKRAVLKRQRRPGELPRRA
jgi:hypothetical protein